MGQVYRESAQNGIQANVGRLWADDARNRNTGFRGSPKVNPLDLPASHSAVRMADNRTQLVGRTRTPYGEPPLPIVPPYSSCGHIVIVSAR